MDQQPYVLTCGCVWRGKTQACDCTQSSQIKQQMDTLCRVGQARSAEWYRLAVQFERNHAP
jgi:hypothetical protein